MIASKDDIRRIVAERKQTLSETIIPSQAVVRNLLSISEFLTANMVMTYVDFGKEVRTVPLISMLLGEKRVAVPYCEKGELQIFRLKNLNELAPGCLGILEPKIELRNLSDRKVVGRDLQVVLVPGVAFDHNGGRVGRGKGYYDRFLEKIPDHIVTIGLAFDCQIFDEVPMQKNDRYVDIVVTETSVYKNRRTTT